MSKRRINNARLAAAKTLAGVLDQKLNLAEADRASGLPDPRDRALARHLSYGVLRWLSSLQWIAGKLLDRPLKRRDRDIERLIWLGLHQLWKDQLPAHAAIHETAECARSLGKPWAVGLVNAVLRRFQRESEKLLVALEQTEQRYAHPGWLLESLRRDWPEQWKSVVNANNQAAPLWLRINRSHPDHESVESKLADAGFDVQRSAHAPDAIAITPSAPVDAIPGFSEGVLSVQDPAAQLAVDQLDLRPDMSVLDACAAPGGKTCHILERLPSTRLVAVELHASRIRRIHENLERLGMADHPSLELIEGDASATGDWWDGRQFDRILLDAPCTATGVIRRHPEIKWLRTPQQVSAAAELQSRLLRQLWPLLKPGGILVYATCSVLKQENETVVTRFSEEHEAARSLQDPVDWGLERAVGRQILPGQHEMDGFFYARFLKAD